MCPTYLQAFGAVEWWPPGQAGLCGGTGHPNLWQLRQGVISSAWRTFVIGGAYRGRGMELSLQFDEFPGGTEAGQWGLIY